MKVVFFSSVLNHHQLPICKELYKSYGADFVFVATMELEEQRRKLGYEDIADQYSFCLKMNTSKDNYEKAYRLSQESDILIAGVIPPNFLFDRLRKNKITFRYSESIFRKGFWRILTPRAIGIAYKHHFRYRNKPFYLLCASAYLPWDVDRIFSYPNKKFKWGYFPEFINNSDIDQLLNNKVKNVVSILWVGRFIGWKQPEMAIQTAKYLADHGIDFKLEMIGVGPIRDKCIELTKNLGITKKVEFLGSMSPDMVRQKMNNSDIFLFTSNAEEGWGVVLNEAMNSGCAVVANNSIGSVPYLIENGINGIIYTDKNKQLLYESVENLILDAEYRKMLSKNAYNTIAEIWNPQAASRRLIKMMEALLAGFEIPIYEKGPLSNAQIIKR